jgi:putative hydrolase of the HAD superfamily
MNNLQLSNIDAIIFDLGGVILNLDFDLTINAFKELGGDNFDLLFTKAYQDKIFDKFETGQINSKEFVQYMLDFLPDEVKRGLIYDAWNAMLLDLPHHRIDFLNEIKQTHRIFLLSNTNEIHYKEFSKRTQEVYGNSKLLEEIFEKAYFSHLLKKRKPNADAFQVIIDNHNLEVGKTVFIDDSIQHIEGAKKVGLLTYHLVNEDIINIFDRSNH